MMSDGLLRVEVRYDKGSKDISGGSHMAVSTGADCGTDDIVKLHQIKSA